MSPNDLEDRVEKIPEAGCWLWMGACTAGGYGHLRTQSGLRYSHRVSYEIFVGPIPEGKCVLHRCDVRCCVNPHHLWAGSHSENTRDAHQKGRMKHFWKNGRFCRQSEVAL